uniref:Fatty acyl-CoA reductase n=1 Tax=Ciona savignyi TaxID=51511 RepID=H2Y510_CIOSA
MNVLCVRRLMKLKWNNLQAFVHVSTAYAHADRKYVKEEFYDCGIDYLDLEATLKWLGDDAIEKLTPDLLKTRPNTYTLTKALAEDVICRESGNLPICIVRPSMIIPAWQEPMPGWCTNVYGPTAFIIAYGKGLLRCCLADREITADLIPVDFVVNGVIGAAMKTANDFIHRRRSSGYNSSGDEESLDDGIEASGSERSNSPVPVFDKKSSDQEIMSSETGRKSTKIQIYHINTSTTNPLKLHE